MVFFFDANIKKQFVSCKQFHKSIQLQSQNGNYQISIIDIIAFFEEAPLFFTAHAIKSFPNADIIKYDVTCGKCHSKIFKTEINLAQSNGKLLLISLCEHIKIKIEAINGKNVHYSISFVDDVIDKLCSGSKRSILHPFRLISKKIYKTSTKKVIKEYLKVYFKNYFKYFGFQNNNWEFFKFYGTAHMFASRNDETETVEFLVEQEGIDINA